MNEFAIPTVPLEHIQSEPFTAETADEVCHVLESHCIHIHKAAPLWTLSLPTGTIQSEIWPRTINTRYKVILPDGFLFYLTIERTGRTIIRIPLNAFSEEFQNKYENNDTSKVTWAPRHKLA